MKTKLIGPRREARAAGVSLALMLSAAVGLVTASPAAAGPPTEALRSAFAQVNTMLAEPAMRGDPTKRMAACRELFGSVFDMRSAAQYSLGREWQTRTPQEQDDFTMLFGDLLESSYMQWLATTADVDPKAGLAVRYVAEAVDGDTALVQTAVSSRRGREVPVAYEMVHADGRWMVRDVQVNEISVLANYRAQFARVIRDSSYAGLLARMKALRDGGVRPAATAEVASDAAPKGLLQPVYALDNRFFQAP